MSKLKNILNNLQTNNKLADRKQNLDLLTQEICNIFAQIQNCKSLQESQPYFDLLEETELILAPLVFGDEIKVTESIWRFTKDFDRVDDMDLRRYMFTEIKNDRYKI